MLKGLVELKIKIKSLFNHLVLMLDTYLTFVRCILIHVIYLSNIMAVLTNDVQIIHVTSYAKFTLHDIQSCWIAVVFTLHHYLGQRSIAAVLMRVTDKKIMQKDFPNVPPFLGLN